MKNEDYIKIYNSNIINHIFHHNKIDNKVDIYSIGCENSRWDVEKIASLLNTEEIKEDVVIFNTCCVTELSQSISERIAERMYHIYPDKKIFFIGCGVTYNKEYYSKFGNSILEKDKFKLVNYGYNRKNNNYNFENTANKTNIIKIQDGCYNNCTYCIISKLRSHYIISYEKIKAQINELIKVGKTSFTLFGTDICSYNYNGMRLSDLCKQILTDFPEIDNLMLDSIDPGNKELDRVIEVVKNEPKLHNVLKLSAQSCSDYILKAMNRRHDMNRLREIKRMCGDDIQLEFEIIIGFPGETDELFQETLDGIEELKIKNVTTYIFSRRKGTVAYDMPNQIPVEVCKHRQSILYEKIQKINNFLYNKDSSIEFFKYKPNDLNKCDVKYIDLYENEELYKLFDELSKNSEEEKDVVIITNFNPYKDIYDLIINIRLLVLNFGVKVITKLKITDDIFKSMNILEFSYNIGCYTEFEFDKLEYSSEYDVLNFFKELYSSNLYDIKSLLYKLIKSGNKKYLNPIMRELDIYDI